MQCECACNVWVNCSFCPGVHRKLTHLILCSSDKWCSPTIQWWIVPDVPRSRADLWGLMASRTVHWIKSLDHGVGRVGWGVAGAAGTWEEKASPFSNPMDKNSTQPRCKGKVFLCSELGFKGWTSGKPLNKLQNCIAWEPIYLPKDLDFRPFKFTKTRLVTRHSMWWLNNKNLVTPIHSLWLESEQAVTHQWPI